MLILKNADVYAPEPLGLRDVWTAAGKILSIQAVNSEPPKGWTVLDLQGLKLCPGFIDQHIHLIGAGGKAGFASLNPEIPLEDLVATGSTTVVGLLGTDGSGRSIKTLYSRTKALDQLGISAYMFTGYYGLDPNYITESVMSDMVFIDKVLGCKIAISDVRSSYPTDLDLLRLLRDVRVGGKLANKKGILHLHLGNLRSGMDQLFRLVEEHQFPIENISPTHVGRYQALFEQAIAFAKLGGMIDITTGASKYTEPWEMVIYALNQGVEMNKMTFSTDGYAGLDRLNEKKEVIGWRPAPITANYEQFVELYQRGGLPLEMALQTVTSNPAHNLGLTQKGRLAVGADADFLVLNEDLKIEMVLAHGQIMLNHLFANSLYNGL